jgi:hypothetical protein
LVEVLYGDRGHGLLRLARLLRARWVILQM